MPTICGALFNYGRINLTKSISQKDRFYNILIKTTIFTIILSFHFKIHYQLDDILIFLEYIIQTKNHLKLATMTFLKWNPFRLK